MNLTPNLQPKILFLLFWLSTAIFAQQKTELVLQMGHTAGINNRGVSAVAVSPDGLYLASGGYDKVVKLWFRNTGQELRTYIHSETITSVAFTTNSKRIIAADAGKGLKVWDIETNNLVFDLTGHEDPIQKVTVSTDGKFAASCAMNNIKLWDLQTGACVRTFGLPKLTKIPGGTSDYATIFYGLSFSPDGKYIYTGGIQQTVNVWETATGNLVRSFGMHDRQVQAMDVSPDGKFLATGTFRGVKIFDIETGKELRSFGNGSEVRALAFTPDGTKLLVTYYDVILYDVATGSKVTDYKRTNYAYSLAMTTDGKAFAIVNDKKLELLSLETGNFLQTYSGAVSSVNASCLSADGKLMVSGSSDFSISIWDSETGKRMKVLKTEPARDNAYIIAVAISTDKKLVLASGSDKYLYVWEVESGKLLSKTKSTRSDNKSDDWSIGSIAIAADNKTALLGAWKEIVWWNIEKSERIHNFIGHGLGMINDVKFSPNGKFFISACEDKSAKIWDLEGKKLVQTMGSSNEWNDQFKSAVFSPDGNFAFGASMIGNIRMWDVKTGSTQKFFTGHTDMVKAVAVSPDGTLLASASYDKTIKIWNIGTGLLIRTLEGHLGNVLSVAFTTDGKNLISGSQDGTLRQWNVSTGKELLAYAAFANTADYLNFTPEGYYTGSKGAFGKGVFYRKGLKLYNFDQFDLQFNRPDVVLERIGNASPEMINAYKKAVDKRIRKMGFNPLNFEKERSFNVPEISLPANTAFIAETTSPNYSIAFSAADKLFNLDRFFIEVNGVPLYGVKGKSLLAVKAKNTKQTVNIPLSMGKNSIKISVMNEKGIESLAERFEITYKPATLVKPNLHIVTIGVSKFIEKDFNLSFADKDANDVLATFKTQTETYGKIFEYSFTNEKATKLNILNLRSTLMKTAVDDQVIVFIASHGIMDKELDYYIAMHNMTFANPKNGGLRYDELENLLDGIPARNKLVFIDACHSGEVDKDESTLADAELVKSDNGVSGRGFKKVTDKTNTGNGIGLANSFELMKELFADLRRNNGAIVISAAAGKEFAFESAEWKNGVFTYSLLEGLKSGNADASKDKQITVTELRDYVSRRVQELTNGKQNPTSRTENADNNFRVW